LNTNIQSQILLFQKNAQTGIRFTQYTKTI